MIIKVIYPQIHKHVAYTSLYIPKKMMAEWQWRRQLEICIKKDYTVNHP